MDGGLLNMDTKNKMTLAFVAGDRVTYVDDNGNEFAALIRHWWGGKACSAAHLTYVVGNGAVVHVDNVPRGDGSIPGRHWRPADELAAYPNNKRVTNECVLPPFPAEPPITGYRPLSPDNIALMNKVKATFDAVGGVLAEVRYPTNTVSGLGFPADAEEALRNARHHAQTASMWAIRAITRPISFA